MAVYTPGNVVEVSVTEKLNQILRATRDASGVQIFARAVRMSFV